MSVSETLTMTRPARWLRSTRFDISFIAATWMLGVAAAVTAIIEPKLLWPLILIDLWVLGYHHVISTYTRLCFDKESFAQSKFLIFGLFPMVAAATALVAGIIGLWAIFTIYFHWQWFHYARQSWGVSRAYRGKDREASYEDGRLDQTIFWSVPILGLLSRSNQQPEKFLGAELAAVPVPDWAVTVAAGVVLGLLCLWTWKRIEAWRKGELAVAHTLYMVSHFSMFAVAYIFIEDVTTGWLAVNIWHNAQYILFVWLFNSNRFKNGVDPQKRFLSSISQPNRLPVYLAVCLSITVIVYVLILGAVSKLFIITSLSTVLIYQTINFHHYIVDSLIWKVRKKAIRQNIGIEG